MTTVLTAAATTTRPRTAPDTANHRRAARGERAVRVERTSRVEPHPQEVPGGLSSVEHALVDSAPEPHLVDPGAVTDRTARTGRPVEPSPTVPASADQRTDAAVPSQSAPTPATDGDGARPTDPVPTHPAPRDAGTAGRPARARLVPTLPPAPRPAASAGPGHTRPPTLEQRLVARRRATLAAERAARSVQDRPVGEPMPDPTPVCCAITLAATEALVGTRAVAQLARWVTPQVFEHLAGRAALTVRVLGSVAATRRPEILRIRVCRIGEHVAEAAVVVDDGRRVRAVALRLEMWRGAWRAVALEIG